jgi:hypothetical protein
MCVVELNLAAANSLSLSLSLSLKLSACGFLFVSIAHIPLIQEGGIFTVLV